MSRRTSKDKKIQKIIARKRIDKLFQLAEQSALSDKLQLSNRYVDLARRISMRYLVSIPKEYKRRYCKHCYYYLLPDITTRIRIKKGKIVILCKNCQKYTRIPLKNSKKKSSVMLK
jgi:ribonuclease P protein subunit RPR2